MDIGMAVIYSFIFATCILVIIGFLLLLKFLPDVKNPLKKLPKNLPLNVVEAPLYGTDLVKNAWNTISEEAKKEIPTMEVKVSIPPGPFRVQTPSNVNQQKLKKKPTKRRLTSTELSKRKLDTRPGRLKRPN